MATKSCRQHAGLARVLNRLATPLASAVLGIALAADFWSLSPESGAKALFSDTAAWNPLPWMVCVIRGSHGLRVENSWEPNQTAEVALLNWERNTGVWATTHRERMLKLQYYYVGPRESLTDAELPEADALVIAHLQAAGLSMEEGAVLKAGGVHTHEVLRWGYVHNALTLTAVALFVGSLRWVPSAIRRARARVSLRVGHCTDCGYDLSGLPTDALCPEGGTAAGPKP
jgi:hypothetical protein